MLRTDSLAFSASDTFRRLCMTVACENIVIVIARVPVMERLMRVEGRKHIGDTDPFRALVLFDAVAARGTRDKVQAAEDGADFLTAAISASSSGLKSRIAPMLSSICAISLMPDSTIAMLG